MGRKHTPEDASMLYKLGESLAAADAEAAFQKATRRAKSDGAKSIKRINAEKAKKAKKKKGWW